MWCPRPPWRIGRAGVHIKEEIIIYIYSYIWDWSDWVCIVRKESQPLTPNSVFLVIFLFSAPFLIIHLAYPVKWNFLEHPFLRLFAFTKFQRDSNACKRTFQWFSWYLKNLFSVTPKCLPKIISMASAWWIYVNFLQFSMHFLNLCTFILLLT